MTNGSARRKVGTIRITAAALLLAAAPAAMLLLGGCDALTPAPQEPSDGSLGYPEGAKLSAYYRLTNELDFVAMRRDYAELEAGKAKVGDTLFLDSGRVEAGLLDLRSARALDGSLPELDKGADAVLAALGRLNARAKGLNSYFTMRGYLTDDYARARREDAAMLADYDAVIAAFAPFAAAAEQATAQQEALFLKRARGEGRMNVYYDTLIGRQTRAIRAATSSPTMVGNSEDAAHADRLVAALMPLLDKDRAAWTAAIAKTPENERPVNESGVVPMAEQMIGAYRQYRRTGDADDYDRFRFSIAPVLQFAD